MEQYLLYAYLLSSILGLIAFTYDIQTKNADIPSLMKLVWVLTIAYSGLFGLAVYWKTGRKQIKTDSLLRKGFRSTAHCYSGCGLGEIVGVTLAVTYFSGTNLAIIIGSFGFAYIFGFALTVGPLMQDSVPFLESFKDALSTETASITIMEIAAVTTDIYLMGGRPQILTDPFFWVAIFTSLSIGFIIAYPVNIYLIKNGVKSGMMNPQHYGEKEMSH